MNQPKTGMNELGGKGTAIVNHRRVGATNEMGLTHNDEQNNSKSQHVGRQKEEGTASETVSGMNIKQPHMAPGKQKKAKKQGWKFLKKGHLLFLQIWE